MRDGKLLEQSRATARDAQQNFAAVRAATDSLEQSVKLHAVHQLDGAVMLDLQALGKHAHGSFLRARQSLNRQQGLMLLRLDAGGTRGLLAEIHEPPDLVAKFRQRLVIKTAMRTRLHGYLELYRNPI